MEKHKKTDKVSAVVTGGTAGIGRAISRIFLKQNMKVFAIGKTNYSCKKLIQDLEHNSSLFTYQADVKKENEIYASFLRAIELINKIDILVINAGCFSDNSVEHMSTEEFNDLIDTNIKGAFFTAKIGVEFLKKTQGHIVFIGSANAFSPEPGLSVYASTKCWLRNFALSLQGEISKYGITVSIINPSRVNTEMGRSHRGVNHLGLMLEADEVADAVLYCVGHEGNGIVQEVNLFRRGKWG